MLLRSYLNVMNDIEPKSESPLCVLGKQIRFTPIPKDIPVELPT